MSRKHKLPAAAAKVPFGVYFRRHWWLYLMLLPGALHFIVFKYVPISTLFIAFQDYNPFAGYFGSPFVGLKHFRNFFGGHDFMNLLKNTLAISKISADEKKVYFYEKLGIYSLIAQISNGKFLDDYVESRIGELIKADQMQEGGLCETLETYLAHNCNANAAAEYLFIHRNTMRYRMDKIKRILDDDINDMEVFLELKLAFAIKRYRENRTVR